MHTLGVVADTDAVVFLLPPRSVSVTLLLLPTNQPDSPVVSSGRRTLALTCIQGGSG